MRDGDFEFAGSRGHSDFYLMPFPNLHMPCMHASWEAQMYYWDGQGRVSAALDDPYLII